MMTGLSYRTTPLATREAVSLTREQIPGALDLLKPLAGHGVILSTCNRTEVYTVARDADAGREALDSFFSSVCSLPDDELRPNLYGLEQEEAVAHLFRVAAGLDSLIIGESEVLGQVRDAFGIASRVGMASGVLAHVFHSAIRTGKRARTETEIGRNSLSVSRACVELTRRTLGELHGRHALILGVGEASKLAARALRDSDIGTLTIANRTPENAHDLGGLVGADVASFDELPQLIAGADVVVSSTGAPDFVVARQTIEEAMMLRRGERLLVIDLALPRDIDPTAAEIDGVSVRTMDDLEAIAEANRREREAESHKVEDIVGQEVVRFGQWWDSRGVTPTIASIRHRAEQLRATEVAKSFNGVGGLSPDHADKVEAMTKALVKKLLHDPTKALRSRKDESFTQSARELFALDES